MDTLKNYTSLAKRGGRLVSTVGIDLQSLHFIYRLQLIPAVQKGQQQGGHILVVFLALASRLRLVICNPTFLRRQKSVLPQANEQSVVTRRRVSEAPDLFIHKSVV